MSSIPNSRYLNCPRESTCFRGIEERLDRCALLEPTLRNPLGDNTLMKTYEISAILWILYLSARQTPSTIYTVDINDHITFSTSFAHSAPTLPNFTCDGKESSEMQRWRKTRPQEERHWRGAPPCLRSLGLPLYLAQSFPGIAESLTSGRGLHLPTLHSPWNIWTLSPMMAWDSSSDLISRSTAVQAPPRPPSRI